MTDTEVTTNAVPVKGGAFRESLTRNNKKIRADRAEAIVEDAETIYRRTIEDLKLSIRRKERERENMLDLSPENTHSLKLASEFDADEYVRLEIKLGVEIRNDEIKLEIAEKRYEFLFGGEA
jgi:hypothetical protein